jgi:hypothetical protein
MKKNIDKTIKINVYYSIVNNNILIDDEEIKKEFNYKLNKLLNKYDNRYIN